MLNVIWLGLLVISVISALLTGNLDALAASVTHSAALAFKISLSLTGIMALWLGLMKIAEQAGLVKSLARLLKPLLLKLFPDIRPDHPVLGIMVTNLVSSILGLGNAATPFGVKAMEALEAMNPHPGTATNTMCLFLTLNTSSVQLIPVSGMAFLAAGGALSPHDILVPTLCATVCSTFFGVLFAKWLQTWRRFRLPVHTELSHD